MRAMGFRKLAYGRPRPIRGWPLVDKLTDVGVRYYQITRFRPAVWGYDVARGKK